MRTSMQAQQVAERRRLEIYAAGLTDTEMACALGIPLPALRGWRQRRGLFRNEPRRFCDRQRMYDLGLSDREIAKRLGISRQTIGDWRRRRGLPAKARVYGENAGIPMDSALSPSECEEMRRFLAFCCRAHALARRLGVEASAGMWLRAYREGEGWTA